MLGRALLPRLQPLPSSSHHIPGGFNPLPQAFTVTAAAATAGADSVKTKSSVNTPYQVLCINHTATQTEIRAAYRSLAKLYHPDVSSSDPKGRDFIQIHDAYVTLSDPVARANYDLSIGVIDAHCHFRYSTLNTFPGFQSTRRWETDQCW